MHADFSCVCFESSLNRKPSPVCSIARFQCSLRPGSYSNSVLCLNSQIRFFFWILKFGALTGFPLNVQFPDQVPAQIPILSLEFISFRLANSLRHQPVESSNPSNRSNSSNPIVNPSSHRIQSNQLINRTQRTNRTDPVSHSPSTLTIDTHHWWVTRHLPPDTYLWDPQWHSPPDLHRQPPTMTSNYSAFGFTHLMRFVFLSAFLIVLVYCFMIVNAQSDNTPTTASSNGCSNSLYTAELLKNYNNSYPLTAPIKSKNFIRLVFERSHRSSERLCVFYRMLRCDSTWFGLPQCMEHTPEHSPSVCKQTRLILKFRSSEPNEVFKWVCSKFVRSFGLAPNWLFIQWTSWSSNAFEQFSSWNFIVTKPCLSPLNFQISNRFDFRWWQVS